MIDIRRVFALLAAFGLLGTMPAAGQERPRNPVLTGADPHIAAACGRFWIYPTNAVDATDSFRAERFYAWSSPDLQRWTRSEPILSIDDIGWIKDDGAPEHFLWAPAIARANGRYYFYYSVGPQNPTPSRIGVAVGDRPDGPFRDSGRPLVTGGDGFEAIDPMVFTDPASGTSYLYAGGSAGATLRVWELGPDMVSVRRQVDVETPARFTEGAFMHLRNGTYYLSYSHGRFNDATYSSHYATAPSPIGPWTYRGEILTSDATRKGPGHHSIVQAAGRDRWLIAYHRWDRTDERGPFEGVRVTAVQALRHGSNGRIGPIRMTDAAPPRVRAPAETCR